VKYECVYLNDYETVPELEEGLQKWFRFYNTERPHSSLPNYMTPLEFYEAQRKGVL
jgi:putative transposase